MASTSSRLAVLQRAIGLPSPSRKRVMAYVAALVVAGAAALVFGMWLGGNLRQTQVDGLAIGGTGNLNSWVLVSSKLLLDVTSVGVVGMLTACLLLPVQDRKLSFPARRCLRTASWLALLAGVSNATLLMTSWSDVVSHPVSALPLKKLFTETTTTFPDAADYISTTAAALVISVAVSVIESRRGAMIVLPLACYDVVLMALQGHASHGTVLKYSLVVHVLAMSLWVGGLAALLAHARREPTLLAVAVPRFSVLALGCYIAVASSGILAAWELLQSVPLIWASRYGELSALKAVALITLGVFGWWHRRHTVRRIRATDDRRARRAFIRLSAGEVVIMTIAVALAVALSRSASPDTTKLHSGRGESASFQYIQYGVQNI